MPDAGGAEGAAEPPGATTASDAPASAAVLGPDAAPVALDPSPTSAGSGDEGALALLGVGVDAAAADVFASLRPLVAPCSPAAG